MMAACKLLPAEFAVLQLEAGQCSWQSVAGARTPKAVLLLGVHPAELAIQAIFRLHALNAFSGRTIVPALALDELEQNPAAKKDLWEHGLKPLLGL